jgi:hypothetical protein
VSAPAARRLRRLLRRAARHPRLELIAWRVNAWRRQRTAQPPRAKIADRRARIALPPRIRAVELRLEELAAGHGQIVAGPWEGSLELELLYWIPFLRWFARRFEVARSRLAAVSRPGAGAWYADVCGSYSSTIDELDGRLLSTSVLEELCGAYWQERGPLVHVLDRLEYARVQSPLSPASSLEPDAVVVWPGSPGDELLLELAGQVGATEPVAVLGPGDGADVATATAAVAGARQLVGAWDGRLMLGPMLGVPTVGLTDASSVSPHLDLAQRAARALESRLLLVDRSQIELVAALANKVSD